MSRKELENSVKYVNLMYAGSVSLDSHNSLKSLTAWEVYIFSLIPEEIFFHSPFHVVL